MQNVEKNVDTLQFIEYNVCSLQNVGGERIGTDNETMEVS